MLCPFIMMMISQEYGDLLTFKLMSWFKQFSAYLDISMLWSQATTEWVWLFLLVVQSISYLGTTVSAQFGGICIWLGCIWGDLTQLGVFIAFGTVFHKTV